MVDKVTVFNPSVPRNNEPTQRSASANPVIVSSQSKNADPFKTLNLDQLNLSDDAKGKLLWARSQFELSYQVIRSMNTAQGRETSEVSFSFSGSIEFLQKVSGHGSLTQPPDSTAPEQATQPTPTDETAANDALATLQDYFSPEKTAERILDIALSFYGVRDTRSAEGDSEVARKSFADFIGAAIEEGFKQARTILGSLPEDVESGITKTHSLVFDGLDDFVLNGIKPEKLAPGGVMEKITRYRQEATDNLTALRKNAGSGAYNAQAELNDQNPKGPTVSKLG